MKKHWEKSQIDSREKFFEISFFFMMEINNSTVVDGSNTNDTEATSSSL